MSDDVNENETVSEWPMTAEQVADALKLAGLGAVSVRLLEVAAIANALERCGQNRTYAAAVLVVSVRTLQRKLKQPGMPQAASNGS